MAYFHPDSTASYQWLIRLIGAGGRSVLTSDGARV
jgi:hypothetical protein